MAVAAAAEAGVAGAADDAGLFCVIGVEAAIGVAGFAGADAKGAVDFAGWPTGTGVVILDHPGSESGDGFCAGVVGPVVG